METVVQTDALEGLHALLRSFGGGFVEDGSCALFVLVLVLDFFDLADEKFFGVVEIRLFAFLTLLMILNDFFMLGEIFGHGFTL